MPNRSLILMVAALAALACGACGGDTPAASRDSAATTPTPPAAAGTPTYGVTVVATLPHDPLAFTEGLFIKDGQLYEGTGIEGKSDIRRVDLATGAVRLKRDVPAPYFGEGIVAFGERLYELTWKQGKAFVYDLATFRPTGDTLSYTGEGWGLTTDGASIVMSDGTARLRFLDPKTFAVQRTIDVHDGSSPVSQLNELEWVKGEILANVWQSQQIARIDPKTGTVTGWIDLTGMLTSADKNGTEDVLNGIAYDQATDKLYVTGKYYSKLYQIALVKR